MKSGSFEFFVCLLEKRRIYVTRLQFICVNLVKLVVFAGERKQCLICECNCAIFCSRNLRSGEYSSCFGRTEWVCCFASRKLAIPSVIHELIDACF